MNDTIELMPDRIDQQQRAQQLVEAARADGGALAYQHASTERDRRIAQEMAAMLERERHASADYRGDHDDLEDGAA